jgi:hypothetical protein
MLASLEKLKTLLTQEHSEPRSYQVIEKPERKLVVPIIYRGRALSVGACSEKLYFSFCGYCQDPFRKAELVAIKGNVCLMSCNRTGCNKLFRIDTA